MRLVFGFLFSFFSLTLLAQEKNFDVTVDINGRVDAAVLDDAQKKVIWQAALDYPALLSGTESLSNSGEFRSELVAITAAAIDVEDVSVLWERENGVLNYVGHASIDMNTSMKMINGVKNNLELQKSLEQAYSTLNKAIQADVIDDVSFSQALDDVDTRWRLFYLRDNLKDTLQAKEVLRVHYQKTALRKVVKPLLRRLKFEVADVTPYKITVLHNMGELLNVLEEQFGESCQLYIRRSSHSPRFTINTSDCLLHQLHERTVFAKKSMLPIWVESGITDVDIELERSPDWGDVVTITKAEGYDEIPQAYISGINERLKDSLYLIVP